MFLEWMKRHFGAVRRRPEVDAAPSPRQGRAMSGKYLSLHKYLDNRYADTVVLTFADIEDLLGFALPDLARGQQEWWTKPDPATDSPGYSDSWLLASRTAIPNLFAQTVVFERVS